MTDTKPTGPMMSPIPMESDRNRPTDPRPTNLRKIRFTRLVAPYNEREAAAFPPIEAWTYVKNKAAVYEDDGPRDGSDAKAEEKVHPGRSYG